MTAPENPAVRVPAAIRPRAPRPWLALPPVVAAMLVVAGCGAHHDRAAFRDCMSQHGVTMPSRGAQPPPSPGADRAHRDPNTPPPGVDQTAWTTARAACASLLPSRPPAAG